LYLTNKEIRKWEIN